MKFMRTRAKTEVAPHTENDFYNDCYKEKSRTGSKYGGSGG